MPHLPCRAAVVPWPKQHRRSIEVPAHYGGDEFALELIDSAPAMAEQVAERFLQEEAGEPPLTVTSGCTSKKSSRKKLLTAG